MNSSTMITMTAKWLTILRDYEKTKAKHCRQTGSPQYSF
jgi:hypothetical protein